MDVQACHQAFPVGAQYDVIVVDPPWYYAPSKDKKYDGTTQYGRMSLTDIQALPVPTIASTNCALLLWCTSPHLMQAHRLFDAWGFHYKTVFLVWRKIYKHKRTPRCGLGHYTRSCHEFLLLGVKGNVLPYRQTRTISQAYDDVITQHSEKPQGTYDQITAFFGPHTRNIDLFARHTRPGWDAWGLELPSYVHCTQTMHASHDHDCAIPGDTDPAMDVCTTPITFPKKRF